MLREAGHWNNFGRRFIKQEMNKPNSGPLASPFELLGFHDCDDCSHEIVVLSYCCAAELCSDASAPEPPGCSRFWPMPCSWACCCKCWCCWRPCQAGELSVCRAAHSRMAYSCKLTDQKRHSLARVVREIRVGKGCAQLAPLVELAGPQGSRSGCSLHAADVVGSAAPSLAAASFAWGC